MTGTLMLNGDWKPLRIISFKRAVVLVMQGKAEVLANTDQQFRSASTVIDVPDVIRLKYFVKIPYRSRIPLSRKNVMARDRGQCQYCHKNGDTIDHVHPTSRGGRNTWTNVVVACRRCNYVKGDKLLSELGWTLDQKPAVPEGRVWMIVGVMERQPSWEPFLAAAT